MKDKAAFRSERGAAFRPLPFVNEDFQDRYEFRHPLLSLIAIFRIHFLLLFIIRKRERRRRRRPLKAFPLSLTSARGVRLLHKQHPAPSFSLFTVSLTRHCLISRPEEAAAALITHPPPDAVLIN